MLLVLLLTVASYSQVSVGMTCDETTPELCFCPDDGWTLFGAQCYSLSTEALNYEAAEAACEAENAQLIEIYDETKEAAVIGSIQDQGSGGNFYIGLTDKDEEGSFKWNSGAPLDYTDWVYTQPDDHKGNEDCTEIMAGPSVTDGWNDRPCTDIKRYICEKDAAYVCPDDRWVLIGTQCYYLSTERVAYDAAETACQAENAQLVEIFDETKEAALIDFLQEGPQDDGVSIGLTDRDEEDSFKWNSGASLVYTDWVYTQPDNYKGNEDCTVLMFRTFETNGWNDRPCTDNRRYICELNTAAK